jgi:hypothetical protein
MLRKHFSGEETFFRVEKWFGRRQKGFAGYFFIFPPKNGFVRKKDAFVSTRRVLPPLF